MAKTALISMTERIEETTDPVAAEVAPTAGKKIGAKNMKTAKKTMDAKTPERMKEPMSGRRLDLKASYPFRICSTTISVFMSGFIFKTFVRAIFKPESGIIVMECCDVTGRKLEPGNWLEFVRADGRKWIPAFVKFVDEERCIGCGMCVRICLGNCYELREKIVNGKKKKVSVVVRPENCYGDCHCHKVCPVPGGAMVCEPKRMSPGR